MFMRERAALYLAEVNKACLKKIELERSQLQADISERHNELRGLQQHGEELYARRVEMRGRVEEAARGLALVQEEKEKKRKEMDELDKKLKAEVDDNVRMLESRAQSMKEQYDANKKELSAHISRLESINTLKTGVMASKNSVELLEREYRAIQEETHAVHEQILHATKVLEMRQLESATDHTVQMRVAQLSEHERRAAQAQREEEDGLRRYADECEDLKRGITKAASEINAKSGVVGVNGYK